MNANTLFEIYEITRDKEQSDLVFGLAMYKVDHPEISHEEDKTMREFMGKHGKELAKAFPDKAKFIQAVADGVAQDTEDEKKANEAQ